MKRISLLFIFLILLSGLGTAGDFPKQSNKKRKVPIKSTTGVPVFRSPIYSPVQVFIYGNVLMVNFQEALKNVLVQIENIETNEIILLKSYDAQIGTVVDVSIYGSGQFQISFSADTYEGYGEFYIYGS